jgi:hypothetical protein
MGQIDYFLGDRHYLCLGNRDYLCRDRLLEGSPFLPSFRREQAEFDGAYGCLGTVRNLELGDDSVHVVLDGAQGYRKPLGYLPVCVPLNHQSQDLRLPGGQQPEKKMRFGVLIWGSYRGLLRGASGTRSEDCGFFLFVHLVGQLPERPRNELLI